MDDAGPSDGPIPLEYPNHEINISIACVYHIVKGRLCFLRL